jgi:cystathionine beta-synthase
MYLKDAEETPNWYVNQYDNPSNAVAHESTDLKLEEQTEGKITHFIVGVY